MGNEHYVGNTILNSATESQARGGDEKRGRYIAGRLRSGGTIAVKTSRRTWK